MDRTSRSGPVRAGRSWWVRLLAVAAVVAGIDLAVKALVLTGGDCCGGLVVVYPNDRYLLDTGAGASAALAAFSVLALAAATRFAAHRPHRITGWAVGLVVGGGIANAIDRLLHGEVTDFINVANTWVINLADVATTAGLVCAVGCWIRRSTTTASDQCRGGLRRHTVPVVTNNPPATGSKSASQAS